jgi:hypothetical protein
LYQGFRAANGAELKELALSSHRAWVSIVGTVALLRAAEPLLQRHEPYRNTQEENFGGVGCGANDF